MPCEATMYREWYESESERQRDYKRRYLDDLAKHKRMLKAIKDWEWRCSQCEDIYDPILFNRPPNPDHNLLIPPIHNDPDFNHEANLNQIYAYFGKEVFHKGLMVNVSPKWKGKLSDDDMLVARKFLKTVIYDFFDTVFLTKMDFVIECGGEGNFPHVHAVFVCDPHTSWEKSWVGKGHHHRSLRACWDKVARKSAPQWVGLIDAKVAIASMKLLNRRVMKDKLNYLVEDLKPASHRNAQHPHYPRTYSHSK